jgi:hypothetical protein
VLEKGVPFRIFLDLHVTGDPKCQGCKKSPPTPCKEVGCAGLVHEEEAADGNESGYSVWTERCCDVCGDPEELRPPDLDLGIGDVDLPPTRGGRHEAKLERRYLKRSADLQEAVIEDDLLNLAMLVQQKEEIEGKINLRERAIRGRIEALAADSTEDSSFLEKERHWELRLKQIIGAESIGLTEAIRRVVWGKPGMTARQVRDSVMIKYRILQGYSNPLAAVHTVLKRLCGGIDIEQTACENGDVVYNPVVFSA